MEFSKASPILVTGATGYVASNIIKILLERDYKVRGTVRSLAKKEKYEFLTKLVPEKSHNLEFAEADLMDTKKWLAACEGVEYVLHVASPFPASSPKDENEIIKPAVDGTLNVLKACVEKGVKKVIVTSSVAAIYYGHKGRTLTEDDWSIEEQCSPYPKSKLRAERAAWDFWRQNIGKFEMATVNPGLIVGPVHAANGGTSEQVVADFLLGKFSGIPRVQFCMVDVRDVAECHIKALFSPISNGKRYVCSAESMWMKEIGAALRGEFEKYGYKIPSMTVGKFLMSIAGIFDKRISFIIPEVGIVRDVSNKLSVEELGMTYIKPQQSLIDMGYSLIKLGAVPDKVKNHKQQPAQ